MPLSGRTEGSKKATRFFNGWMGLDWFAAHQTVSRNDQNAVGEVPRRRVAFFWNYVEPQKNAEFSKQTHFVDD